MRKKVINIGKAVKPIKEIEKEIEFLNHVKVYDKRVYIYWTIARVGGYRSTEILNLKVRDIKAALKKGYLALNEKKTGKVREIPIERFVRKELNEIIKDKLDHEVLLPSRKGSNKPLTYRQMQRLMIKYGRECLIKDLGTHSPRKTAGYHIYIETGDIYEVKDFLQHDNLRDTYAYIDVPNERRLNQVKATQHPLKYM